MNQQTIIIASILALFTLANRDQPQPARANAPAYNPFEVPSHQVILEGSQLELFGDSEELGELVSNTDELAQSTLQSTPKADQLTTGVVIYVRDDGSCPACDRLKADLMSRIDGKLGWSVGWEPTDDFQFAVCKTGTVPTLIFYEDGRELFRKEGYRGLYRDEHGKLVDDLTTNIVNKHPKGKAARDAKKLAKAHSGNQCTCENCPCSTLRQTGQPATTSTSEVIVYESPPVVTYSDPVIIHESSPIYQSVPVNRFSGHFQGQCVNGVCYPR